MYQFYNFFKFVLKFCPVESVSLKPRKLFEPTKPFLVNMYLQREREIYMPETSCMKGTSLHIKDT